MESNKHMDDSWKSNPIDDVWIGKYYKFNVYTVEEAVNFHRETHHPTMYNVPNAPIFANIEINMQGEKVTRFVENFHKMAPISHKFEHGEDRSILVFTKGLENIEEAKKAGATIAGDANLIKSIQNGDLALSEFQFIIAHNNMLPELVHVRGLMKRKFPNPKLGTLGTNVIEMINRFMNGITYSVIKDENQKDFALTTVQIGTLNMPTEHIEENLTSLLKDIDVMRPKREGKFISRVILKSPPSKEEFKINPFIYVPEERVAGSDKKRRGAVEDETADDEELLDDDEKEKKEAVN